MTDKDKKRSKPLSAEDRDLWHEITRDIKPLPGAKTHDSQVDSNKGGEAEKEPSIRETITPEREKRTRKRTGKGLDGKTEQRLRKGQIPIEASIDLHGMGQSEAHETLNRFVLGSHERGLRCVLVITGTGRRSAVRYDSDEHWTAPKPGILKERAPVWLGEVPLRDIVLRAVEAQPKDGGQGALYVLLRRKR